VTIFSHVSEYLSSDFREVVLLRLDDLFCTTKFRCA